MKLSELIYIGLLVIYLHGLLSAVLLVLIYDEIIHVFSFLIITVGLFFVLDDMDKKNPVFQIIMNKLYGKIYGDTNGS